MPNDVEPGLYRHFKGGFYLVISEAKNTETDEDMVVYQGVNSEWFVRPKSMFFSGVCVDGDFLPRFEKLIIGMGEKPGGFPMWRWLKLLVGFGKVPDICKGAWGLPDRHDFQVHKGGTGHPFHDYTYTCWNCGKRFRI